MRSGSQRRILHVRTGGGTISAKERERRHERAESVKTEPPRTAARRVSAPRRSAGETRNNETDAPSAPRTGRSLERETDQDGCTEETSLRHAPQPAPHALDR